MTAVFAALFPAAESLTAESLTSDSLTTAVDPPPVVPNAVDPTAAELPCWRCDPELFFAESPADVELAKSLCLGCPLRSACLAGAVRRREPWGVWGGELFVQGVVVPRKRPRGRPRKEVAA